MKGSETELLLPQSKFHPKSLERQFKKKSFFFKHLFNKVFRCTEGKVENTFTDSEVLTELELLIYGRNIPAELSSKFTTSTTLSTLLKNGWTACVCVRLCACVCVDASRMTNARRVMRTCAAAAVGF